MKFYPLLVQGITDALLEIYNQNRYADKTIEFIFKKNKKWGSKDRHFVAFSIYESVRWWRRYCALAEIDFKKNEYSKDEIRKIISFLFFETYKEIPGDFKPIDMVKYEKNLEKLSLSEKHSLPDSFMSVIKAELGDANLEETLDYLNKPAEVYLRTNVLKTNRSALKEQLEAEAVDAEIVDGSDVCLKLKKRKNVFVTKAFKDGHFEMQDFGSQKIVEFCDVKAKERIIDACAGAGGKSLYISGLMGNTGKIIGMDIHEWKLNELRKRAKRDGVQNIETRVIESSKAIKRLKESADLVLLDVPCSGSGVLRRNPDTKWKFSKESLSDVMELQADILSSYAKMCKPDGRLVYSTCSIFKSENQNQVKNFLKQNSDWKLDKEQQIFPQDFNCDGFYMAMLKKK